MEMEPNGKSPQNILGCPSQTSLAGRASVCEGCPGQMLCQSQGGVDPDQEYIDIRMKPIKHKILVLSGKGAEGGHAKDFSVVDGLVSTVTETAIKDENVGIKDTDDQSSILTDGDDQNFSPESDIFSLSDGMSEDEYSALEIPFSQQFLSLQKEEHLSGSESCASDLIQMEMDLPSLQKSKQDNQMSINKMNDSAVIACNSIPSATSAKGEQKSLKVMNSKNIVEREYGTKDTAVSFVEKCVFCGKLYPTLAHHFKQKHKDELDVSKALSFPKTSTARLSYSTKEEVERLREWIFLNT
ncbi:hypothetical protein CHS0354_026597 [Potamilus streckersoni]|uniref:Uncharacterized protein n=1 Tax=Potamilus streckersoni TaxID=2493646 RepID=A0AAE0SUT0_9BIVA|nr:hypothetical protein CHS0354_026597 [Potamilus streckersoni]